MFLGFDEVLAEDFSGVHFCDRDGCFIDEHQDSFASVFCSDSEVMHFSCPSERNFSFDVEAVCADSVMPGEGFSRRCCFEGGVVGIGGSVAVQRTVGAFGVVGVLKLIELLLKLFEGVGFGFGCKPSFLCLVEPFDLSLGLWMTGGTILLSNS